MVQEFRLAVNSAAELLSQIESRFRAGDPAEDLLQCLAARLADVERRAVLAGPRLPPEFADELGGLLARLQAAVSGGEVWLTQADDSELTSHYLRERVRQVYGLATRPD